jgi:hypothetical protein
MNYQRHYNALIQKALNRSNPEGYTEKHHIVPRSIGGSDDPNNLVVLTAREHCVAHLLLAKIHGGSLWNAAVLMMNRFGISSSRIYAMAKEEHAKVRSLAMMGNKLSLGFKHSDETKQKWAEERKSRGHWAKEKNPGFGKGELQKGSLNHMFGVRGVNHPSFKGPIIATNIVTKNVLKLNGTAEIRALGFNPTHISSCLTGKRNSHKGFTFYRESDIFEAT